MFELKIIKKKAALAVVFTATLAFLLNLMPLSASPAALGGVELIESSPEGLMVSYKPALTSCMTINLAEGGIAVLPQIEGALALDGKAGSPITLANRQLFAIPTPDAIESVDISVANVRAIPKLMAPIPQLTERKGISEEIYSIDNKAYYSLPDGQWATVEYSGFARFFHLGRINFIAARFNPASNSIEIPEEIIVRIKFKSGYAFGSNVKIDIPINNLLNMNIAPGWALMPQKSGFDKKGNSLLKVNSGGTDHWVRLGIEREGIYRIDGSALTGAGVFIPKEEISTIKIFGKGSADLSESVPTVQTVNMNEQEIIVRTNASGDLESIIFYGAPPYGFRYDGKEFRHYQSNYSDRNYYLLSWGGDAGKRAEPAAPAAGADFEKPSIYTAMIFKEENLYNAYIGGSGKMWLGRNLFPVTFDTTLTNLEREGYVDYRISLAHRSKASGTFEAKDNDNTVFRMSISGVNLSNYCDGDFDIGRGSLPAQKISVDGHSKIRIEYDNVDNSAIPYFDWYEIYYPHSFIPENNEIGFFTNPKNSGLYEYSINSYGGGEIIGFDVTDSQNPHQVTNVSNTGGMFIIRTLLANNSPQRLFVSSNFKQPSLDRISLAGLRDETADADLILITHRDLLESANQYKQYRESHDGLKVKVAATDDIYNEFAYTAPDPTAIRDYIAYCFINWNIKPRYVLLWGDGHYDYKSITGTKNINYVPPYESSQNGDSFDLIHSWTSDDFFVNVAGLTNDWIIDLGIGRIPVFSQDNGKWIVEKIKQYENNSSTDSWRTQVTLVADDSWRSDGWDEAQHTNQSEDLSANILPRFMQQKKLYLVEYPTENIPGGKRKPGVEHDMLNIINTGGTLFLNWIGHGNPRVWAHEEILERSTTIPKMLNIDKLFFCTAATCDFGRFDMPDIRCGAEEMMISKFGGAIGVFASTRVAISPNNHEINSQLYRNIFTQDKNSLKYLRLGDVIMNVKQNLHDENDKKFFLLGDPAMRLLIPEANISIDSLKGKALKDLKDTIKIKALEYINISGSVLAGSSTITDSGFGGTAVITMLDGDEPKSVLDIDQSVHLINEFGGALNRSSTKVDGGRFSTNFYIPKDISFSPNWGRLYAYAYSNDNKFAKGFTNKYLVSGLAITNVSEYPDKEGPSINIYFDSRDYQPGDRIRCNPLLIVDLYDISGINSTGRGLGHKIEAWIDGDSKAIDITDKFVTNLENPRKGSIEYYLNNLSSGGHTIKIRAWDVFNNYSEANAFFVTNCESDGIIIYNLFTYPNPFDYSANVVFKFNHNASPPYSVDINIFSVTGNRIYSATKAMSSAFSGEMTWDGLDMDKSRVSSGMYYYTCRITGAKGAMQTETGIISIYR